MFQKTKNNSLKYKRLLQFSTFTSKFFKPFYDSLEFSFLPHKKSSSLNIQHFILDSPRWSQESRHSEIMTK